ncbi:hypothetical protein ACH5RR_012836 [Cinchona calisaya]|uniref:Uncharacterized protein n=1 Tax=Cinchona calisaya TaxID=153742 RepID=A0ABD3ACI6_9GENT
MLELTALNLTSKDKDGAKASNEPSSTRQEREALWVDLRSLKSSIDNAWFKGDFNVILEAAEYSEEAQLDAWAMDDFNSVIHDCHTLPISFSGSTFTWTWVRHGGRVWKQLDKALGNQEGLSMFSSPFIQYLNHTSSNHSPLSFKLFDLSGAVKLVDSGSRLRDTGFSEKLKRLKLVLRIWKKDNFGNVYDNI